MRISDWSSDVCSSDLKPRALQRLARKGIGMPRTAFAHAPDDTEGIMQLVGGAPMVIKPIEGAQGEGVVLAELANAAESVIAAFRGRAAYFMVQEFVRVAQGCDIRCFVVRGGVGRGTGWEGGGR